MTTNRSMFKFLSKLAILILCILGLIELGLALWTILEDRYKSLAYTLSDVGYIDLWVLRYLSMCLFASSIITLVMCLIYIWGLYSAHVFLFIASTMIILVTVAQLTIAVLTFTSKFAMRMTLQEQLPKLVITYRQGNDERANRALDVLQSSFHCCGSDGRLSFQNNVPLSCNMFSIGCLTRTMFFLDSSMDSLAAMLFFFSIVKFLIVLFFYSFLCLHHRYREKTRDRDHQQQQSPIAHSAEWRHSSSFDSSSSSSDNLPKKLLISSNVSDLIDKRRVILNDYESQYPNKRVQDAPVIVHPPSPKDIQEQNLFRKLSSISEKTEKTETDESNPDLLRMKNVKSKRPTMITAIPPPLPKKLPIIKNRKKLLGEEENDSGVEHSSSEKSFDGQHLLPRRVQTPTNSIASSTKSKTKSTPTLSFSNVFVTSISQPNLKESSPEIDMKKSLSTSSAFSDHLLLSDVTTPKPILKKTHPQSSPSSEPDRIPPSYQDEKKFSSVKTMKIKESYSRPKPAPRPSLKQSSSSSIERQEESLV